MSSSVRCTAAVEYEASGGSRVVYKSAVLRLARASTPDRRLILALESDPERSRDRGGPALRWSLPALSVHARFVSDGKAAFRLADPGCTLLVSNAPPAELRPFLEAVRAKSSHSEAPVRSRFPVKSAPLDDVSPVTKADLDVVRGKRKLSGLGDVPEPASRKKLYSPNDELDEQQKRVLDACLQGKNVFFTGSAGTGKSFLLKRIIAALPPDATAATASTGVAACHIGGTTLHAFAGIGNGEASVDRCVKMASTSAVAQKWKRCKHLIVDEISMVDGNYFEKVEEVARRIRKNDKPFGGIQLIICGDFLQLPPVIKEKKINNKRFCFQTETWDRCIQRSYELQVVHRQKDPSFISMLNSIRIGRVTEEITNMLTETAKQQIEGNGILATRLCSHTNDSNLINESKLKQLKGNEVIYNAEDSEPYSTNQLDSQTVAPSKLILKEGAQVMLLKNINVASGLVNGARGVVTNFQNGLPVVTFKNSKQYIAKSERWVVKSASGNLLSRKQVPLALAWAFSIHKSQGLTLDCVEMSLSKIFEAGQAYVALSRAQSLQSLRVLDFNSKQVWANPDVLEFYQKFRRQLIHCDIIPIQKFITNKNKTENALAKVKQTLAKKMLNKPLININ